MWEGIQGRKGYCDSQSLDQRGGNGIDFKMDFKWYSKYRINRIWWLTLSFKPGYLEKMIIGNTNRSKRDWERQNRKTS